jgi:hypothetical protein
VLAGTIALVCAGMALAAAGDPRKNLNPADQATAKSFLLRKADLGQGWVSKATGLNQPNPPCFVQHYSLSKLTVTGEAGVMNVFQGGVAAIESDGHVFGSSAQARRAFAILSRPGLARCQGAAFASEVSKTTLGATAEVVRVAPLALARLPVAARAFRVGLALRSGAKTVPLDLIAVNLQHGRAHGSLTLIGSGTLWTATAVRRLASKMAARIARR